MSSWLAHPNEFGAPPRKVKYQRSYIVDFPGWGKQKVHLLNYEMPDGTKGRGFVNPVTWSFLGDEINSIPDDTLLVAYCGWSWLFTGINQGVIETKFPSEGEKDKFQRRLSEDGLTEVRNTDSYKIGSSEIYEFTAQKEGKKVKGAGNTEDYLVFNSGTPEYFLPAIYFLLGRKMRY